MPKNVTVVLGSPFPGSSSEKIADFILSKLNSNKWNKYVVDLSTISAEALLLRDKSNDLDQSIEKVTESDLIISTSPTYRATYTGLLKSFFDKFPLYSLVNKFALAVQTGGSADHGLTIEYGMGPMLRSLGATILSSSIYSWGEDWTEQKEPTLSLNNKINLSVLEIAKLFE